MRTLSIRPRNPALFAYIHREYLRKGNQCTVEFQMSLEIVFRNLYQRTGRDSVQIHKSDFQSCVKPAEFLNIASSIYKVGTLYWVDRNKKRLFHSMKIVA